MAAFLLLQLTGVASQRQIIGVASPGNTVHVERDVDLSYDRTTINVSSVVPVTVQRNNYGSSYLDVVRIRLICNSLFMDLLSSIAKRKFITRLPRSLFPVPANFAKVLVTSDCDTSETSVVPNVVISDDGSATFEVDVPQDESDAFLGPSSYSAFWTWVSDYCGNFSTDVSNAIGAKATALVGRTLQTSFDGTPVIGTIILSTRPFCRPRHDLRVREILPTGEGLMTLGPI